MENFEVMMKRLMVKTIQVCGQKCILQSDRDYLNGFEKNCLGKCADKYFEMYFKSQQTIVQALPEDQQQKELDENF